MKQTIIYFTVFLLGSFLLFFAIVKAIDKELVVACNKHNKNAQEIDIYWVSSKTVQECSRVGITINANIKND